MFTRFKLLDCNYIFISEQMRQNDRVLRKTERELDRDRRKLELEEKKLVRFPC